MKKKRNKGRGEGQTSMTISLSEELKSMIRKAADDDSRTMANWAVVQFEKYLSGEKGNQNQGEK